MTFVAVIGNFVVPYTTESFFAKAFEENGCTVTRMQVDDVVRDGDAAMGFLRTQQLCTYTRTHARGRYLDKSWTDRWQELERSGVRTVSLHLDRFFDLERESLVHDGDAQFTTGTVYTADGGSQERFASAGVEDHRWLVPAMDRAEAEHLGTCDPRGAPDVLFVGSGSPYHEQEYPQRGELVRYLADRYGERFWHVGHGGRPVVRGLALNTLYRSARVVVGDSCFAHSPPGRRPARYWSDRWPETLGRSGFFIAPWIPGCAEHYETGRHLVTCVPGDFDDMDAQIGAYLAAPGERDAIAAAGREHVLRTATWSLRMSEILCAVGLGDCGQNEAAA